MRTSPIGGAAVFASGKDHGIWLRTGARAWLSWQWASPCTASARRLKIPIPHHSHMHLCFRFVQDPNEDRSFHTVVTAEGTATHCECPWAQDAGPHNDHIRCCCWLCRTQTRTGLSTRWSQQRAPPRTGSRACTTTTSSRSRRPAWRKATAKWCAFSVHLRAAVMCSSSTCASLFPESCCGEHGLPGEMAPRSMGQLFSKLLAQWLAVLNIATRLLGPRLPKAACAFRTMSWRRCPCSNIWHSSF